MTVAESRPGTRRLRPPLLAALVLTPLLAPLFHPFRRKEVS
jgi:hypothetical protein